MNVQGATGLYPLKWLILWQSYLTFLKKQKLWEMPNWKVSSICQDNWSRDEIKRESIFELKEKKKILMQRRGKVQLQSASV